jgi:hypothetical protein
LKLDWQFLEKDAITFTESINVMKLMLEKLGGKVSDDWAPITNWTYDASDPYPPQGIRNRSDFYTGDSNSRWPIIYRKQAVLSMAVFALGRTDSTSYDSGLHRQ